MTRRLRVVTLNIHKGLSHFNRRMVLHDLRDGLRAIGLKVVEHPVVTPIVPVLVEDDWKAVLLWRALYDAGVYTNVAIHPAVPPGGALLRTSVMATHDRATLDAALESFASIKEAFEADHGLLPS